jgi:hypothetical protein
MWIRSESERLDVFFRPGEFSAAVPRTAQLLAYTWRYKGQEGDSLVTFELFPEGDKTRLKLTHEGLETFPKLPAYARKNFEAGWTKLIGSSLKDFLENMDRETSSPHS